ncbi:MAG: hypothetical protein AAF432_10810 [Planctomycetota bacterium]
MKRLARNTILFLLLGAVINVAVAWGIAACLKPQVGMTLQQLKDQDGKRVWYSDMNDERYVGGRYHESTLQTIVSLYYSKPFNPNFDSNSDIVRASWNDHAYRHWMSDELRDSEIKGYEYHVARGWPLITLRARYWHVRLTRFLQSDGITLPKPWVGVIYLRIPRVLPTTPIWSGIILNSLFYAVVGFVIVRILLLIRHIVRARRNRCRQCGYPRGTSSVCSECGHGAEVMAA